MRFATDKDLVLIRERMQWLKRNSTSQKMQAIDDEMAMHHIERQIILGNVMITNGCMVMGEVFSPWYSRELGFVEDLFITLDRENCKTSAIQDMIEWARSQGAHYIVVGDTQLGLMTKYYEASGFTHLGTQLYRRT
jgi:hypothetical protein